MGEDQEPSEQEPRYPQFLSDHKFVAAAQLTLYLTVFLTFALTGSCSYCGCGFTRDYVGDYIDMRKAGNG